MEPVQAGPNIDKIVSVLSQEKGLCEGNLIVCKLRGTKNPTLKREVGCAIGALLFHAGWSPARISELRSDLIPDFDEYQQIALPEDQARKDLQKVYGLSSYAIELIMEENDYDSDETPQERRDRVVKFVREML